MPKHRLVSDDHKSIIQHARKSLLFDDQQTWIKRDSGLFDVTMKACNGTEVSELVGNYLLYKLSKSYKKRTEGCIEITDWWFLRITVDQNQKNLISQLYFGRTS